MNAKRMLLIGTMAAALSFGSGVGATKTSADPQDKSNVSYIGIVQPEDKEAPNDDLQQLLGVSSEQEIYDALYAGQSLADIANANNTHVQHVINLQVAELTAQLDARLASGNLSVGNYHLQKAELEEMVTASTYASQALA